MIIAEKMPDSIYVEYYNQGEDYDIHENVLADILRNYCTDKKIKIITDFDYIVEDADYDDIDDTTYFTIRLLPKNKTELLTNDFFESLVEGLSEDEKIDLWNSGKRKVNIKACSDEKLNRYYDIANSKGYITICDQIEQEAASRGLTLSGTYTSPVAPTYTANSGSPTAPDPTAPDPEAPSSTTSAAAPKSVLEELKEIAKKNAPRAVTYKMSASDVEYYEEQLMNELVPGCGDSDTLAGEILSAWNYGLYRCLNDGDWFYGFGTTWNTNAQRCVQYLKDYVGPGLGNAAMYATGEYDFADKGNKLILNKIFKEKLYNYRCRESWRSYNYN